MQEAKFNVIYSEDSVSFLQRIDEKTRVKILENIDKATRLIDPKLFKKLNYNFFYSFSFSIRQIRT